MFKIARNRGRRRPSLGESGFTLTELLITIVILGLITASITVAFSLSITTSRSTADRAKKSNDAQFITKYLVPDAASAGGFNESNAATTEGGSAPGVYVRPTTTTGFCNMASSVVRFEWISRAPAAGSASGITHVAANYTLNGNNLTRNYCTQPIAANGSTAGAEVRTSLVVGKNVAAATAACFPVSPCGPGLVTPVPTIVTLNVTETASPVNNSYSYSASGYVRAGGLEGTSTTATVPLIALGVPLPDPGPPPVAGAPCPATAVNNNVPTSSGVAVAPRKTTSSPGNPADPFEPKITVFGIAAINSRATTSTTTAPCGQAGNIAAPTGWFAAQTLVASPGTCNNCGTTIPIAAPLPDPYAGMTPPTYNCGSGPNVPVGSGNSVGNERRYTAGTYRTHLKLEINNGVDQYIFGPGVYVFCNGLSITSGILAQSSPGGVLFYFAGGSLRRDIPSVSSGQQDFSDINFQIDGRPEYRDVVIWQPNPTTSNPATTGDLEIAIGENDPIAHPLSSRYGGVIYAPQAQVEFYLPTRETLGQYETVEATAAGVVARKIVADRISRIRLGDGPQTTTTLTVTPDPATVGQPVTLRATVAPVFPATGVPTGVVTFIDDSDQLGTSTLVNGVATLVISSLGGGARPLKAIYSGDLVFASSVSPTRSTVFNQAPSNTVLVSGPNPASVGQPITMTATVTGVGTGPVPTGTVTFFDGAAPIATLALDGTGRADFTTTLTEGTHPVRARYDADASYLGSVSPIVNQVVKQGSGVAVFSTPNPSNAGQSVQLRAEVRPLSPGPVVATGTVTFFDTGNVQIGAGNIPLDVNGDAILNVTTFAGGPHNITARYSGDVLLAPSNSAVHAHTVNFLAGSLSVVSGTNPSVFNQPVTFTATFTGSGPAITGTMEFRDNGNLIGSSAIQPSGVATFSYNLLALGSHSITARYTGNGNYGQANSPALTQVVQAGTITTLVSDRPTADWGQPITFTATVVESPTGSTNPIGNVNFYDDGGLIGQVALSGTTASLTTSPTLFPVGTHHITATFAPTAGDFTTSTSAVLNQNINLATTTMAVTSTPNPAQPSQLVSFTATVSAAGGIVPTGTVAFFTGSTYLGQSVLVNGVATFTNAFANAGTHSVTAIYPASGNFRSSTFTMNQVVLNVPTTTTLSSTANPAVPGESVTIRADIASSVPNPTGSVFFYDGTTFIGSGNVGDNYAILVVTGGFTAGTHMLTANYVATGNFQSSTSAVFNQVVGQVSTSVAVTSDTNPAGLGQPLTLHATVTAAVGSPTGQVSFFRNNTAPLTFLGSAVVTNGVATLTVTNAAALAAFTVGNNSIYANYTATGSFSSSNSPAYILVMRNATTITLARTTGADPATFGQSLAFTATVGDSVAAVPTGTVTFLVNGVQFGSPITLSGTTAVLSNPALPVGTHSLTAMYNGDAAFAASPVSSAVSQTINPAASAANIQVSAFGSSPNRPSFADSVAYTFSTQMAPGSIAAGFTGTSTPVTARLQRGNGPDATTTLSICTTSACTTVVNLGTVNLGDIGATDATHYLLTQNSSATAVASMSMNTGAGPSVVTIFFNTDFTPGANNPAGAKTLTWTPSTLATDLNGVAMSGVAATELGASDPDF